MASAQPLPVKGRVVCNQQISSVQQLLEVIQSWFPGLRQARYGCGDAIDGLSGIGLNRQQAGHLGQDLPAWDIEQNRPDFEAVMRIWIEARGFRINDQQSSASTKTRASILVIR